MKAEGNEVGKRLMSLHREIKTDVSVFAILFPTVFDFSSSSTSTTCNVFMLNA